MLNFIFLFASGLQDEEESSQSLLSVIAESGPIGLAILVILFVLSFLALYIFIERWFTIKKAAKIDENFMNNIRANVGAGNIAAAKALCQTTDSPVARMVEKGLMRIGKPLRDIDAAIENVGNLEIFRLEKNLSKLATIAGAAPMIGFLGTVIGMVMAFHQLATASGQADMGSLAKGIYTAMTTTVAGLIVGIIAYIGYNHLVVKTDKVVHQMESTAMDFLDILNEPA